MSDGIVPGKLVTGRNSGGCQPKPYLRGSIWWIIRRLDEDNAREGFIEEDQYRAILNEPEHHWHDRPIGAHLKGWREACKRAELSGLKFHNLRRPAVGNMERAGMPRNVAMGITGHSTEAV
jgi:hypothetical protein